MAAEPSTDSQARWESLIDALLADRDLLAERICKEMRDQLPSYRRFSDEELMPGIRLEFQSGLEAARGAHDQVSDSALSEVAGVGELRARQGVAIDDLLLAWRIGVHGVLTHGRELAAKLQIDAAEMLTFVQALLASSDRAMAIIATAHRGAELQLAREEQESRAELVQGVLLGTLSLRDAQAQVEARGMEPDAAYVAIRARVRPGTARSELERGLGFHETTPPRRSLAAVIDGDLAGFLRAPPRSEPPGAVGIGPERPLEGLPESFALATRALATASAFDLRGLWSVETLGVLPAVVDDAAVGEALGRRYLTPLAGSTAEIAASLRAYLSCEMQIDRAARELFVHPNTLRYRISRFEELTGGNLRDPRCMFEVWWALEHARIRADSGDPG
jgi:hypothetical protein